MFTCFTRENFFIFFSVSEMAKKLRNLNRLAWQKCLFHQFSSHKHKRENILDQIIKKKSFTCSSGLPQNTDYDCCHFCLFGSHCSYIVSILCYHFIYKCNFFLLVYLSVLIMSSGLLLHPKFILPYLYFNHLTCSKETVQQEPG